MGLEIAPIERSRCVDSQAWCFFFSTRKKSDVGASRSRVFREKLHYFLPWDLFQKEIPPCVFSLAATGRGSLCALNIFAGDFWGCFKRFATSYY